MRLKQTMKLVIDDKDTAVERVWGDGLTEPYNHYYLHIASTKVTITLKELKDLVAAFEQLQLHEE